MKKITWVIPVLVLVSIVFMGCPGQKELAPMDNTLTSENAATLIYRNYFKIKEFNGKKASGFSTGAAMSASRLIPAGMNTLKTNYNDRRGIPFIFTWGVKANGMVTTFDFQPGKTYVLVSRQFGSFLGPIFFGQRVSTLVEELPDGGLREYMTSGFKTREEL